MSKCFTLIQKNVKTENGNISEHDCYNSRKQFFLFFAPVCSVLKNRNSKFHKALLRAIYHRRDQYCLYMHVCEHSHSHTQHIHYAFQWHPQDSQGGFHHHRAARPPAPGPENALQPVGGPTCLGISGINVLSNTGGGCPQDTLKTGCSGLAQSSLPSPQGSHTTRFRVLLLSPRADPGFGLTNFRPHSLVLM